MTINRRRWATRSLVAREASFSTFDGQMRSRDKLGVEIASVNIVSRGKFRTGMVHPSPLVVQINENVVVLHRAYARFVPEIQRACPLATGVLVKLWHFGSAIQLSLTVHLVLVQNYYRACSTAGLINGSRK